MIRAVLFKVRSVGVFFSGRDLPAGGGYHHHVSNFVFFVANHFAVLLGSRLARSNPNGLLSHKLCHYLNKGPH